MCIRDWNPTPGILSESSRAPLHLTGLSNYQAGIQPGFQVSYWLGVYIVLATDYDFFIIAKPETNVFNKLPAYYYDLANTFSKRNVKELLSYYPSINLKIYLKLEGKAKPLFCKPYAIYNIVNNAIKKQLDKQLVVGLIRKLSSPYTSPIIVIKKLSRGLRVCVNYRLVNKITIKSRYPILLIKETLARILGKRIFTKLDIIVVFNRIRITKGYE